MHKFKTTLNFPGPVSLAQAQIWKKKRLRSTMAVQSIREEPERKGRNSLTSDFLLDGQCAKDWLPTGDGVQ